LKDIVSITVRLTEKDPIVLHSHKNLEKLEMCLQAVEIMTAISFSLRGIAAVEREIVLDERKMQVSLVYSAPPASTRAESATSSNPSLGDSTLFSSLQKSRQALEKEGIEIETKVTTIETLALPA
jgi:hypothetical protein